ncbi:hypothetical protein CLAIMM_13778 [Cladophialophora immunda]|nr:hypothetical protein CLAIMM_13778 [Cladophialophora immunda]
MVTVVGMSLVSFQPDRQHQPTDTTQPETDDLELLRFCEGGWNAEADDAPSDGGLTPTCLVEGDKDSPPARPAEPKKMARPQRKATKNVEGKFVCTREDCGENNIKEFARINHMDKHDRPYKCLEDGCENLLGFTYPAGLTRHAKEVHRNGNTKGGLFFCPHSTCKRYTGKGFTRRENLKQHVHRCHKQTGEAEEESSAASRKRWLDEGDGDDDDDEEGQTKRLKIGDEGEPETLSKENQHLRRAPTASEERMAEHEREVKACTDTRVTILRMFAALGKHGDSIGYGRGISHG